VSAHKARGATIGLGRHGLRHLQAYRSLEEVEIIAVCDQRPDAVRAAQSQVPGARGYSDWRELLGKEKLDVVSVVTNGPSHAAIVLAAVQAGVGRIFCEKPMATSMADADDMLQACQNRGVRLAVSHGRRWDPNYRKLRELLCAGVIGKLCHLWFTCGGGLFAGNGSHILDLARMLSGAEPQYALGWLDTTGTPNPRGKEFFDPGTVAIYMLSNGMRCVVDMFEDLGVPPRIEIAGGIGRILVDEVSNRWELWTRKNEDRQEPVQAYWLPLSPQPFASRPLDMVQMLETGLRELLGEGQISCTGEDGEAALEMLIGAHVSSRNGSVPVRLPLAVGDRNTNIPFT
jgi:predicted dehydrogenase